jgi:hypothetical protein
VRRLWVKGVLRWAGPQKEVDDGCAQIPRATTAVAPCERVPVVSMSGRGKQAHATFWIGEVDRGRPLGVRTVGAHAAVREAGIGRSADRPFAHEPAAASGDTDQPAVVVNGDAFEFRMTFRLSGRSRSPRSAACDKPGRLEHRLPLNRTAMRIPEPHGLAVDALPRTDLVGQPTDVCGLDRAGRWWRLTSSVRVGHTFSPWFPVPQSGESARSLPRRKSNTVSYCLCNAFALSFTRVGEAGSSHNHRRATCQGL